MNNSKIFKAVTAWCEDETSATSMYDDITTWDTSEVTNMVGLFSPDYTSGFAESTWCPDCTWTMYSWNSRPQLETCNPDISSWVT